MNYAIVTGASKGLGEAVADHLIDHFYHVIDVSRSGNERLQQKAEQKELTYIHAQVDLCSPDQAASFMTSWFDKITQIPPGNLVIVHNAGMVEPIEKVGNLDNAIIDQAVHLNYITPVVLTNIAFQRSSELNINLTVVNITSGAAEKPNHGWSIYGSTKAALNLFTETAALEQAEQGSRNTIISFSPSIMDTDMQKVIRSSQPSAFSQVERFQKFKKEGKLRKPAEVGGALVRLLMEDQIVNGKQYHINDLLH